jgi:phage-related protein
MWVRDKVYEVFKVVGTAISNFIGGAVKSVVNSVLYTIEKSINNFIKMLNLAIKIINKIPGVNITSVKELKIPRLEKGMDFVPKDFYGPVFLDYGERVLTKQENREYSQQQGVFNSATNGMNNNTSFSPTFVIQVGSKEVARTVLNDLQDMAKSNGKPITIQG